MLCLSSGLWDADRPAQSVPGPLLCSTEAVRVLVARAAQACFLLRVLAEHNLVSAVVRCCCNSAVEVVLLSPSVTVCRKHGKQLVPTHAHVSATPPLPGSHGGAAG